MICLTDLCILPPRGLEVLSTSLHDTEEWFFTHARTVLTQIPNGKNTVRTR